MIENMSHDVLFFLVQMQYVYIWRVLREAYILWHLLIFHYLVAYADGFQRLSKSFAKIIQ